MSAQNIIQLGFNIEELTSEKKQVLDLLVDMFGKLKEYDGTKFNPLGSGGLVELKKSIQDASSVMADMQTQTINYNKVVTDQFQKQQAGKKVVDDLTLSTQQYQKILDNNAQTQGKISAAQSQAAQDLALNKEQLKQYNAELQNNAKYQLTEADTTARARAENVLLFAEREKQLTSTEEGRARILELNAAMDKNNEIIRANSSSLEQQKINIGNYTGAILVLKDSLSNIGSQLQQMAAAGDQSSEAFQKLLLEQKLLQQLFEKLSAGSATVTAELRSTKSALDALSIAGLQNTESFQGLNTVYTEAKQKVNELHSEQAILSSQTPGLTALTAAARGIGGAYALGAGAAAVFADGNEKVEKELNKLVGIMTFLQGLEEAVRVIRERGGIVTALQKDAEKALVLIKQVEVALFGQEVAVVEAATAAKTVNTEATEANTGAMEANAEGAAVMTGAMEGVAGGEAAAAAGAVGLRTALIATGIGAIIIGIIYAVTQLVGAIGDWVNADQKAAEVQKELAETSKDMFEWAVKLTEAFEEGDRKRLDGLEKVDAKSKAAGQNLFIQLANEQKLAEERQYIAKVTLASLDLEGGALDALNDKRKEYGLQLHSLDDQISTAQRQKDKGRVEDLQKQKAAIQQEAETNETAYQKGYAAQKDYNDNTTKLEELKIEQSRAGMELLIKLSSDAAQRRYDVEKDANDRILALEYSTTVEKLHANALNYSAEAALEKSREAQVISQANEQRKAAKIQLDGGLVDQKTYSDELVKIDQDTNDKIESLQTALNIEYKKALDKKHQLQIEDRNREIEARNAISKNGNDSDAAIQDAITKDTQKELDARLTALRQSISDKTKVIVDDYNKQIALGQDLNGKTKYTDTELDKFESDRNAALVALTATTQKDIYDIVISYGEKKLKAIEDQNKAIDSSSKVTQTYNADTSALDQGLVNQTISYTKYVNEKRKLDQKYIIDKDAADVADDEKRLKEIEDYEQRKLAIELIFAEKDLNNAKAGGNSKEIEDAQAKYDALLQIQTEAAGKEKAANQKLQDDKLKQTVDKSKPYEVALKALHDKENELAQQSFNLATQLVDASYQNKINHIQDEITKTDEQAAEEVSAVQRSTLSQRDQAAELIIIQANQKARDTQLKNQQKQEKIKEAKFDRDVAAAKAFWATEQAVIEAIATYGGTPYAFAIAAVIAALGAVQIAEILAKPIPSYGEGIGIPGKGEHEGGLAWIGERNKPERITMPGKPAFVVDKPTLMDLPAKTSVLPLDHSEMIYELGSIGIEKGGGFVNMISVDMTGVEDAINKQTYQLQKAFLKGQRKIRSTIYLNQAYGGLDPVYVMTKIIGRKS